MSAGPLRHQLELYELRLVDLVVVWQPQLLQIGCAYKMNDIWGPKYDVVSNRRRANYTAVTVSANVAHPDEGPGLEDVADVMPPAVQSDIEEEDDDYYEGAEVDARVMEDLEILGEQDEYEVAIDGLAELALSEESVSYPQAAPTRRKRARTGD